MSTTAGSCHITSTSASALVSNPHLFKQWAAQVNLDPNIQEKIPEDSLFDPIRHIRQSSKCFPRWLADKNSAQLAHVVSRYGTQIDDLLAGLGRLATSTARHTVSYSSSSAGFSLHDRHDLDLHSSIGMILQTSCYYKRVTRRPDLPPNESELRVGIDNLLNHVYEAMDGDGYLWHCGERQLKLPQTKLQNASVRSVTPDAVDLIACPDHPAYRDGLKARESLSCFYQLEPPQSLFVIHCVADYKQNSSGQLESQAIVGVVSGLYQRKLLGGTNQFVFGLIRRSVHFLQVIAAIWWEGKIRVYEIGSYSLVSPFHVTQLYLILREIKQLGSSYRDLDFVSTLKKSHYEGNTTPTTTAITPTPTPMTPTNAEQFEIAPDITDTGIDEYMRLQDEEADIGLASLVTLDMGNAGGLTGAAQYVLVANLSKMPLERGATWYVVANKWLIAWQAATGAAPSKGYPYITIRTLGPVNNSSIIHPATGEMLVDLELGEDYEVLPDVVWEKFVQWYDKPQITLARDVVSFSGETRVEVYPPVFRIYQIVPEGETPIVSSSRVDISSINSLSVLAARAATALRLHTDTGYRAWNMPADTLISNGIRVSDIQRGTLVPIPADSKTPLSDFSKLSDIVAVEAKSATGEWVLDYDSAVVPSEWTAEDTFA